MNFVSAFILGIVEGITEFIPISSTAHIEIAARILHIAPSEFLKSFEIVIQVGAILAVVVLYFPLLKKNKEIWKRILIAFIPTAVIGFILYRFIKTYILGNITVIIGALLLGGIVLIVFEYIYGGKDQSENSIQELETMQYTTALIIGLAQALAVIPGVSRSAATIVAGRMLGVGKVAIIEFSFLLAIPTLLVAAGYDIIKSRSAFSLDNFTFLLVGFAMAFVAAVLSIKFLLHFLRTYTFIPFGIYRIIIAFLLIWMFL